MENLDIFDFKLTDEDMALMSTLDRNEAAYDDRADLGFQQGDVREGSHGTWTHKGTTYLRRAVNEYGWVRCNPQKSRRKMKTIHRAPSYNVFLD